MAKIFTFSAVSTTHGNISVESETLEEAKAMIKRLGDDAEQNIMTGPAGGDLTVDFESGEENQDADYGSFSFFTTDRKNAKANMDKLSDLEDDESNI